MGEWESIPASAFGAPHGRDRVWIVAYLPEAPVASVNAVSIQRERALADPSAYAHGRPRQYRELPLPPWAITDQHPAYDRRQTSALPLRQPDLARNAGTIFDARALAAFNQICKTQWALEPAVGRMVDGLAEGLDENRLTRNQALGDALIPQIVAFIGLRIQYQSPHHM